MSGTGDLARLAADLGTASVRVGAKVSSAVDESTTSVAQTAQNLAPVDTGELRSSITANDGTMSGTVEAGTDHAFYVEFGTSKMPPQPFMGPALDAEEDPFVKAIEQALDDLL